MRVLLDEQLPRDLANEIAGHVVRTVEEQNWKGLTNGELLSQAQKARFDIFLTADANIEFQQNLPAANIGVVILKPRSNKLEDLRPLVPDALEAISNIGPGQVRLVRQKAPGA